MLMMNDRWTIMNNSSSELDSKPPIRRQRCCRVLLWTLLVLLVLVSVTTATVTALYLNHIPLPLLSDRFSSASLDPGFVSRPSPSSRPGPGPASVGLDPVLVSQVQVLKRCPDLSQNLLRLEALQSSLLMALANHDAAQREGRGLVLTSHDTGHAHHVRKEAEFLRNEAELLKKEAESLQKEVESLRRSQENILQALTSFQTSLTRPGPQTVRPRDCSDLLKSGVTSDGVYSIYPPHEPNGFMVFCDMSTDGGGWTVIQRREDGSVDFFRGWDAYRDGFGRTTGEHWLGLQKIFALTGSGGYELRIDMSDFENATAFARYSDFSVGLDSVNPEEDGFPLFVDGFSGTAGDSLLKHSGMRFTTRDRDQDQSETNCAGFYHGAWWYRSCHSSNLNGLYLSGSHASYADGIEWSSWTGWQYSLRTTEMKTRPRPGPETRARPSGQRTAQEQTREQRTGPGLDQD